MNDSYMSSPDHGSIVGTTFFFLFAPNNSGTTAMCQYLAAQSGAYLPPFGNHEGQMVPTVRHIMRNAPWDPDSVIDWTPVRAEWERLADEAGCNVFVEGSPPNILRVDAIVESFGDNMSGAFSICNPYMQIGSCIKNYQKEEISDATLREMTETWLFKADAQMRNVVRHGDRFPLVRYEEFCAEPTLINKAFGLPSRPFAPIIGKRNTGIGQIVNLAIKNIAFLTVFEVVEISEILIRRRDVLDFFGYPAMASSDYNAMMASDLGLMHAGLLDRSNWEMKRRFRKVRKIEAAG